MGQGFLFRIDRGEIPPPGAPVKTRLAVRAIIERAGRLLLVRSALGDWKFPGGGVQPRETPEDALLREVAEETGYETRGRLKLVGRTVERAPGREVPGSLFSMESLYYRTDVGEPGEPQPEDYEKAVDLHAEWICPDAAWEANLRLLRGGSELTWLEREIQVLQWLLQA